MMIPTAKRDRYAARTRLNEPSRCEKMLHQFRPAIIAVLRIALAVTLDDARVLLRHIQGFEKFARSQHPKSLSVKSIQSFHRPACVYITPELVAALEQGAPVRQSLEC